MLSFCGPVSIRRHYQFDDAAVVGFIDFQFGVGDCCFGWPVVVVVAFSANDCSIFLYLSLR